MSIWMELRCDGNTHPKCYSGQNNGPMGSSWNGRSAIEATVNNLEKEGRQQGWQRVRTDNGYIWLCPECKKDR